MISRTWLGNKAYEIDTLCHSALFCLLLFLNLAKYYVVFRDLNEHYPSLLTLIVFDTDCRDGQRLVCQWSSRSVKAQKLSNSKTMSQTALLHGKMSEMDLSGSCYYNTA